MTAIFIRRQPRGVKGRQNDQPGHNQELVPKRGNTSVFPRIPPVTRFKHCSFKTTDFKPLKQTTELYACAVFFCVRGARFFFFADFEQLTLHKHTYMHQNPRLCKCNPPGPHCHNSSERVSNPGFRCGRRAL